MSRKPLLTELYDKGKPLAEVVVTLCDGFEEKDVAELLDDLCPDIGARIVPAYFQSNTGPTIYELRLDATKEALEREFGWKIVRHKIYDSREDNFEYPDGYCWEELNEPQFYPFFLEGLPGQNDFIQADGLHPNAAGVALLVDALGPYLVALSDLIE